MRKQVFLRALLGIPIGIAIGYVITIMISLCWGNGSYSPCVPELTEQIGSEIGAVMLQTVLCGMLGASFAAASIIWEIEQWSIAKQTGVYFIIISVAMLPIAYFTYWMEHSFAGFLCYGGIFIAIFFAMWMIQYFTWKQRVEKINNRIHHAD